MYLTMKCIDMMAGNCTMSATNTCSSDICMTINKSSMWANGRIVVGVNMIDSSKSGCMEIVMAKSIYPWSKDRWTMKIIIGGYTTRETRSMNGAIGVVDGGNGTVMS